MIQTEQVALGRYMYAHLCIEQQLMKSETLNLKESEEGGRGNDVTI